MDRKVKISIIIAIIILIIIVTITLYYSNKEQNSEEEIVTVEELKAELGATGDDDIYVVSEDSDGRKILTINPTLEYKVALAGILINQIPEQENLEESLINAPQNAGVWISENSRDDFLNLLEECSTGQYSINAEGYLQIEENGDSNIDKGLESMINSEKQYILDISGKTYVVDYITGEIIEEPFEEMDPYTVYEYFEEENSTVIVLTTNTNNKLTSQEILQAVIELCNN